MGLIQILVHCLKSFTVEVDYPPQIHALAWRLKKRCSSATPLRHPHFYPHPFIEDLTEDLIGRPLGFLGGQTYGLKPLSRGWTPRVKVYGDDVTGLYFRLDSGGFASTFRSTIKLENPKRVVFRGWYQFQVRGSLLEYSQCRCLRSATDAQCYGRRGYQGWKHQRDEILGLEPWNAAGERSSHFGGDRRNPFRKQSLPA